MKLSFNDVFGKGLWECPPGNPLEQYSTVPLEIKGAEFTAPS
jgi:hypothetical protein